MGRFSEFSAKVGDSPTWRVERGRYSDFLKFIIDLQNLDPVDLNPDQDPPDPHVFGPPGSFYQQAKIVRESYCFVTSFGLFIFENRCKGAFKK